MNPREPDSIPPLLAFTLAGPPLLVFLGTVFILLAAIAGRHPAWPETDMTMAEAAALRDVGEIVRLVGLGYDPNERVPVRPGIIRSRGMYLTPLEAAVGTDRLEVVHVLLDSGARLEERDWVRLRCFAEKERATEVAEFLGASGPKQALMASCRGVEAPW